MYTVIQVVGMQLPWPKEFCILPDEVMTYFVVMYKIQFNILFCNFNNLIDIVVCRLSIIVEPTQSSSKNELQDQELQQHNIIDWGDDDTLVIWHNCPLLPWNDKQILYLTGLMEIVSIYA